MADQSGLPEGWVIVDTAAPVQKESTGGTVSPSALPLAASAVAIPAAGKLAASAAANPTMLPKALSTVGQLTGAAAELYHGNPLMVGPAAWAGGKGGWFTGKLLQKAAPTVAAIANSPVAHVAQNALAGASALQGGLELSAMADNPKRQDVGFLGMSANGGPIDSAHPPMMNAAIAAIAERMGRPDIADLWRGKGK